MSELPYSLEAEQSVLGAILLDSKCLDRVAEIIPNAQYFNSANHKLIYSTIIDMFIGGQPIDFVTVLNSIKKTGDIDEESYRTYFLDLVNLVPSISNVETYAYIIRDKYNVRILAETAKDIIEEVSKNDLSSSELLDSADVSVPPDEDPPSEPQATAESPNRTAIVSTTILFFICVFSLPFHTLCVPFVYIASIRKIPERKHRIFFCVH